MESKPVLIFPWAKRLRSEAFLHNPKDYPWWPELVKLLRMDNWRTIQLSLSGEEEIGADELITGKSLKEISEMIKNSQTVLTVDSFANHLCWYVKKRAVVLWSQGDPKIFGHSENFNLLKDKKYIRSNQFDVWESAKYIEEAFYSPQEVFNKMKQAGLLNKPKQEGYISIKA